MDNDNIKARIKTPETERTTLSNQITDINEDIKALQKERVQDTATTSTTKSATKFSKEETNSLLALLKAKLPIGANE